MTEFVGPFLFAFVVITVVLLVDFIPDVVKLVVKKQVDAWIIIQVFVLNLAWMLALSIPMAVLSGTLMATGRLSADSEILAMKASGISPVRIVFPLLFAGILLGVGLIFFNNGVLPDANHKARQLMSDIRRTRPMLEIKENVLSDQIAGYKLLVRKLNYKTSEIGDVAIFDYKDRLNPRTITAKRGKLAFSSDGGTLIVELEDGEIHELDPDTPEKYRRTEFDQQTFYLTGVGSEFSQTDSDYRTDREKSAADMMADIHQWRALIPSHRDAIKKKVREAVDRLIAPTDLATKAHYLANPDRRPRLVSVEEAVKAAINSDSRVQSAIRQEIKGIENQHRLIGTYLLEVHKKYSIPAACLVFVLIGAPLGILARRGGIGVGLGMSLGMFILYWASLIGGEDLADRGFVSPAVAMWSANALIAVVGLVLLWRVVRDAPLPLPRVPLWLAHWWERKVEGHKGDLPAVRPPKRRSSFCPPPFKRLSFYLLKSFWFNVLWAQAAFWFLFIIIDMVERLDRYIDRGIPFVEVINYYIYYTPYIMVLTTPIALLLATLFSLGFMGRRNELMAIKASGVPLFRLAVPLLGSAVIVAGLVMAAGEFVLPWADQHREQWQRQKIKGIIDRSGLLVSNLYAQGHDGRVFYFQSFEPKTGIGTNATVQTFRNGKLVSAESMRTLKYEDSLWVGKRGRTRIFPAKGGTNDLPDFSPFIKKTYPQWTETPSDFATRRVSPENMGYRELNRYIDAKEAVGADVTAERTDFQWKFSFPLINVVIVLFGIPIAVRVRQSGMALNFGIAMAITFAFRVMIEIFRAFGQNGNLDPLVSAWTPTAVFLIAGVFMLSRVRN